MWKRCDSDMVTNLEKKCYLHCLLQIISPIISVCIVHVLPFMINFMKNCIIVVIIINLPHRRPKSLLWCHPSICGISSKVFIHMAVNREVGMVFNEHGSSSSLCNFLWLQWLVWKTYIKMFLKYCIAFG